MADSYNTVLRTYSEKFELLPFRSQFHFASRLYLWHEPPFVGPWLQKLRPDFTQQDNPGKALRQLAEEPLPPMSASAHLRQPYYQRYPHLRRMERLMFRTLFLRTVYGLDARDELLSLIPLRDWTELRDQLLEDHQAVAFLSSFAVNFLYILDGLLLESTTSPSPAQVLESADQHYDMHDPFHRQLHAYLTTHCIIAQSLFYARPIATEYRPMSSELLQKLEELLSKHLSYYKLDVLYEFLVCCRLAGYESPLEASIMDLTSQHLRDFIYEPTQPTHAQSLKAAEHRNVLFLMSQVPFAGRRRV